MAVIAGFIFLLFGVNNISQIQEESDLQNTRNDLNTIQPIESSNDIAEFEIVQPRDDLIDDKRIGIKNVDLQILAKDIHGLLNLERTKQNLPDLSWDENLSRIAALRSIDYHSKISPTGDIKDMLDPSFFIRSNGDYSQCGTSQAINFANDIDEMKADLDNLEYLLEIKHEDYESQKREYELSGSDYYYDRAEKTRLEYNSMLDDYDQYVSQYNDKIELFNKMVDDGKYFEGPVEQIIYYPTERYEASTYVELVNDMITIEIPTSTWNSTSMKMETSYTDASLFDDLNEDKYVQIEGIGMSLFDDLLFMSIYHC